MGLNTTVGMVSLAVAAIGIVAHVVRTRRSPRTYSPLSAAELRDLGDGEAGLADDETNHPDRRLTLVGRGEATQDDIWRAQVAAVERALDQALIAADNSGAYSAASLRRTGGDACASRNLCWRIPAVLADEVLRRCRPVLHPGGRLLADLATHRPNPGR